MQKEVTSVEVVRYVATDGEKFTSEAECLIHEDKLKSKRLRCSISKYPRILGNRYVISEMFSDTTSYTLFSGKENMMTIRVIWCFNMTVVRADSRGVGSDGVCTSSERGIFDSGAEATANTVQEALFAIGIRFNQSIFRIKDAVANSSADESIHHALAVIAREMKLQDWWIHRTHIK